MTFKSFGILICFNRQSQL